MTFQTKKISIPEFKEWKRSLRAFLEKEIIPRVLPGEGETTQKYRKLLLTENAMRTWVPAFTHSSFDSTIGNNFEVFEYIGDKLLYYALSVYAKKKYPYFNQDDLNNFNSNFTSRDPLADISIKTGLIDHVRTIKELTETKEKSDIFESVVGALSKIGDEEISPGIGYMIVYNYITSIFNWYDEEISSQMKEAPIMNQVMQGYYDALGWKQPGDKPQAFEFWDPETKTMTLYLNEKAIKMLASMDKKPKDIFLYQGRERAVLSKGTGINKKEAEENAYRSALKVLNTVYKITPEDAKKYIVKLYLESLVRGKVIKPEDAKNIYGGVLDQNRKNGVLWNKTSYINSKDGKMYILNGYKSDNNLETLVRIVFENEEIGERMYKLYLYRFYSENGKMVDAYTYYKVKDK